MKTHNPIPFLLAALVIFCAFVFSLSFFFDFNNSFPKTPPAGWTITTDGSRFRYEYPIARKHSNPNEWHVGADILPSSSYEQEVRDAWLRYDGRKREQRPDVWTPVP